MVTDHTNETEQSSSESAAKQPGTQEKRRWYAIQ
jgi:hypothetical protein